MQWSQLGPSAAQAPISTHFPSAMFTPTSTSNRHSSPAALETFLANLSVLPPPLKRPPLPPVIPSSFADSADTSLDPTHVPNHKHLYITSRLLRRRPAAVDTFQPTVQMLSPPVPSSVPPPPFPHAPPQAAYSCVLWKRSWAFVSSRDRSIRIWDLSIRGHERVVAILEGVHAGSVLSLCVTESEGVDDFGVRVVSAGSDGRLVVWWVDGRDADGVPVGEQEAMVQTRVDASIVAHDSSVLCVRADSKRIVSCSKGETQRLFFLSFPRERPALTIASSSL